MVNIPLQKHYSISSDNHCWILKKYNRDYKFYPSLKDLLNSYVDIMLRTAKNINSLQDLIEKFKELQHEINIIEIK